jgi:hypothetical protein
MSLSKTIVMDVPSDGSDEEISESACSFPSPSATKGLFAIKVQALAAAKKRLGEHDEDPDSIVESSEDEDIPEEFLAELKASAARKRLREQDKEDSDSISEPSEPKEASRKHEKPLVAKKHKVESPEGGQDQDQEQSLPRKSDQKSGKAFEDEATPDPVSSAQDLKVADQEQERAKESLSDQSRHESSPLKEETATYNGVQDAMELKVEDQQQEQKQKSFSEQEQTGLDVLLCDELQEDGPFWQGNKKGRSQSSEASRASATESDVSARDAEQESESSLGPSEEVPSPSSGADEAISVLAALKDPSHEKEAEQKQELGFSKRKPKAKQFFDHDTDTDEDESVKHEAKARRHFDDADADSEENERKTLKSKSAEEYTTLSFPEQIHKMVTETAATQPELINWVHDGEAFAIFEPVRKFVAKCKVVPQFDLTHLLRCLYRRIPSLPISWRNISIVSKTTSCPYFFPSQSLFYFSRFSSFIFADRRYSSLQRQLNMYGWQKHLKGK